MAGKDADFFLQSSGSDRVSDQTVFQCTACEIATGIRVSSRIDARLPMMNPHYFTHPPCHQPDLTSDDGVALSTHPLPRPQPRGRDPILLVATYTMSLHRLKESTRLFTFDSEHYTLLACTAYVQRLANLVMKQ